MNAPREAVYWIMYAGKASILRLSAAKDGYDATLEPDASAASRRENGKDAKPVEPTTFRFNLHDSKDGGVRLTVDGKTVDAFARPTGRRK